MSPFLFFASHNHPSPVHRQLGLHCLLLFPKMTNKFTLFSVSYWTSPTVFLCVLGPPRRYVVVLGRDLRRVASLPRSLFFRTPYFLRLFMFFFGPLLLTVSKLWLTFFFLLARISFGLLGMVYFKHLFWPFRSLPFSWRFHLRQKIKLNSCDERFCHGRTICYGAVIFARLVEFKFGFASAHFSPAGVMVC